MTMCGQYFKYVNPEKKEWIELPSMVKLPEMMSTPIAAQVVMYTLFEGPFDGTTLLDRLYDEDDPKVAEATADRIEVEAQRECERFQDEDWLTRRLERAIRDAEHPGYEQEDADLDDLLLYPDEIRQAFARKCGDADEIGSAHSTYRDDDGSWDYGSLKRTVCAGFKTGEDAMCGRWAGNRVRLVGDYADNDYYSAMYGTIVADVDGEIVEGSGMHPERREILDDDPEFGDQRVRHYNELAEPGDTVRVNGDYGEFIRFEESEWTNITEDVFAEMARYMPDQFGELLDDVQSNPETQFGTGQNSRA